MTPRGCRRLQAVSPSTVTLTGPLAAGQWRALADRVGELLRQDPHGLVELSVRGPVDLTVVDALARTMLVVRRLQASSRLQVTAEDGRLTDLLALCGLAEHLPPVLPEL